MNRIDQVELTEEDPTGELQAEVIMAEFADLQENLSTKLENIGKYIAVTNGELAGIDGELKRLTALKKKKEKNVERLETYVSSILKLQGIEKIEAGTFTYSFRRSEQMKLEEGAVDKLPEGLKKYSLVSELSIDVVGKLTQLWLDVKASASSLTDIKKWYKTLSDEEQQNLAGIIWIDQIDNLQLK